MYKWIFDIQKEQSANTARRPTIFVHQTTTPVEDGKVNPKHTSYMNTPRVVAFNDGIWAEWASYAAAASSAGIVPVRLVNAHRIASVQLHSKTTSTHDGVHLSQDFSRVMKQVVVSTVLEALALDPRDGCSRNAENAGSVGPSR